jgi:FkbM family methyltransferase
VNDDTPNSTRNLEEDVEFLKVRGKYVLPLMDDGRFAIDGNISKIYLNIGVLTLTDFHREIVKDPNLLVLGIEANPKMLDQQSFTHDRFKLFNFAAGEKNGFVDFNINKHPGCSSILKGNTKKFTGRKRLREECLQTEETLSVPMVRIDDFMKRIPLHVQVAIAKIDVQGYDFMVLKSMASQLDRVQMLQFEIQKLEGGSKLALYEGLPLYSEVIEWVRQQGFPKPFCRSMGQGQSAIREVDCTTCKGYAEITAENCPTYR